MKAQIMLDRMFGYAILADGIDGVIFIHRQVLGFAINRTTARDIDDFLHTVPNTALDEIYAGLDQAEIEPAPTESRPQAAQPDSSSSQE